jgi:hypothetical protein
MQKLFHSLQVKESTLESKVTSNVKKSSRIGQPIRSNIKSRSVGNQIYSKCRVLIEGSITEDKPSSI